jgi:hypothetical protein
MRSFLPPFFARKTKSRAATRLEGRNAKLGLQLAWLLRRLTFSSVKIGKVFQWSQAANAKAGAPLPGLCALGDATSVASHCAKKDKLKESTQLVC